MCIKKWHWMTCLYFQVHINTYYNFLLSLLVINVSSLKYKQKVVLKGLTSYEADKIMLAAHSPTLHKTVYWAKISIILFILILCFQSLKMNESMSVVLKNFNNAKQIYTFQCHCNNRFSTVCIGGFFKMYEYRPKAPLLAIGGGKKESSLRLPKFSSIYIFLYFIWSSYYWSAIQPTFKGNILRAVYGSRPLLFLPIHIHSTHSFLFKTSL